MKTWSTIITRDNSMSSIDAEHVRACAVNTIDADAVGPRSRGVSASLSPEAYVAAMTAELLRQLADGYDAYLLTFMFKPLPPTAMAAIMARSIEGAYARVVSRVLRYPNCRFNRDRPFLWLGFPDFPVSKRLKQSLADVAINDGRHVHVIVSVPPFTRLKQPFDVFVHGHHRLFLTEGVHRVHVVPFDHQYDVGMSYWMKSLLRRRIGFDDVIVLPRSRWEVEARRRHPNNGRAGQVRRAPPID